MSTGRKITDQDNLGMDFKIINYRHLFYSILVQKTKLELITLNSK